jgi:hypothetical protein
MISLNIHFEEAEVAVVQTNLHTNLLPHIQVEAVTWSLEVLWAFEVWVNTLVDLQNDFLFALCNLRQIQMQLT